MSRPIIYLDIDGVLNSHRNRDSIGPIVEDDTGQHAPRIDPRNAEPLQWLLQESGAAVVLSSAWRLHRDVDELAEWLHQNGLTGIEIVDQTEQGKSRFAEIKAHVVELAEGTPWVAIDDDPSVGRLRHRVVTDEAFGLTWRGAEKALAILQAQEE